MSIQKKKSLGDLNKNFYRVIQCDNITGFIFKTYENYPKASKDADISVSAICRSIKSKSLAKGFRWFKCMHDYHMWINDKLLKI